MLPGRSSPNFYPDFWLSVGDLDYPERLGGSRAVEGYERMSGVPTADGGTPTAYHGPPFVPPSPPEPTAYIGPPFTRLPPEPTIAT